MAQSQGDLLTGQRVRGVGHDGAGGSTVRGTKPAVLLAEDDRVLATILESCLARCGLAVRVTESPQEVTRWLEEETGPLVLDGSVFRQMGIPLGELPRRAIIWSGDDELIENGRRLGLRTFQKGNLEELYRLLREVESAVEETT